MGMEYTATWSVDDNRHRSAKAYCGLNATAIDLAKIGSLYLKKGNWQGKQIVSEEWVKRAETPKVDNEGYRDQWWGIDGSGKDSLGNYYFPDSLAAVENMTAYYEGKYSHYKIWKDEDAPEPDKQWRIRVYTNCYFALGIMKQVLYIDPDKDLVMVRLGANGDNQYFNLMYTIGKQL